ncbi:hypothetical protein AeMF1_006849 [Aphanomyces euteiches]|nr:hypothetical protein AeMF1_006849 [Aphanomyces euteiches]KAH9193240.1 hypothetical protein AeNC1_004776 [Aphanomyces euteiches]
MGGGGSTTRMNLYVLSVAQEDSTAPVTWIGTAIKQKKAIALDDFVVKNLIGTGMLGHVFIVQHKSSRMYFALKSIWKADVIDRNMLRHVLEERDAMIDIKHPFIVQCFHTFQSDEQIHFLLEYVPGGELFKWLRNFKYFYDHEAKFFAAELLLAIESIHNHGYIYRDLKPENICIDAHGHVKLVDFGFAKHVGNPEYSGRCTTRVGTPQYLAPELLQKGGGYTQAVDWWAFGCLVYELLKGQTPFFSSPNDTSFEIYTRVALGKVSFGDRFTPHAKDLIRQLLQYNLILRSD